MTLHARYTILQKIADGGTAEIFLATQHGAHGFEKPVVLKRIFPAFYADPQFRNMLVDEAHIAMSLNHSNIVQVLDLGEADGQYVLALELVDGWTLDAVLRRARALNTTMPPALALYMTAELCRALAYAHAKTGADDKPLGIVHRDISPHNVLLSEQGEVKLTDFGIAKAHNRRESSLGNIIKGKIAYMSPEQASGGALDLRSDLFSVGTLLYVMICGRYPFDAATDLEVLLLVKNGECLPPEKARPGLNPEIYRVLKRAMAKMPADRYQRADEMLMDFEQVMRIGFRAVGQTELKRWLQDLSMRDGVPPLTRAAAAASTSSTTAGETLELQGIGTTTPATLPPPASGPRANRPPPRAPQPGTVGQSGRGGSTAGGRPPPPPAAMAVGKKGVGALPPRPPGPSHGVAHAADPSRVADPVADGVTPKPTLKPTAKTTTTRPAARPTAIPTARSSAPPPEGPAESSSTVPLHTSTDGAAERATPTVAMDTADSEKTVPGDIPGHPGFEKARSERVTAKVAVLEAQASPVPATPRKSSSWVAEAVAAAAQRAGTAPPPPIAKMVVAPPMILPVPHVTSDVRTPPAPSESPPSPRPRRLAIGVGVGVAALLIIGISMKTCGGEPDDTHAADPGRAKVVAPARVASADPAPPVAIPTDPPPAARMLDAAARSVEAVGDTPGVPAAAPGAAPEATPLPAPAAAPSAAPPAAPAAAPSAAPPAAPAATPSAAPPAAPAAAPQAAPPAAPAAAPQAAPPAAPAAAPQAAPPAAPAAAPRAAPPATPAAAPRAVPSTAPTAAPQATAKAGNEAPASAVPATPGDSSQGQPAAGVGRATPTSTPSGGADPDPKSDGEGDDPATAGAARVSVMLKSSPSGAQVGIPHHPFGSTPISVKLKPGQTYALVFSRDGYRPVTRQIRVTGEAGQQLFATLRPAPPPQKAPLAPVSSPPPPPPAAKPADKSWFQRMFAR